MIVDNDIDDYEILIESNYRLLLIIIIIIKLHFIGIMLTMHTIFVTMFIFNKCNGLF